MILTVYGDRLTADGVGLVDCFAVVTATVIFVQALNMIAHADVVGGVGFQFVVVAVQLIGDWRCAGNLTH